MSVWARYLYLKWRVRRQNDWLSIDKNIWSEFLKNFMYLFTKCHVPFRQHPDYDWCIYTYRSCSALMVSWGEESYFIFYFYLTKLFKVSPGCCTSNYYITKRISKVLKAKATKFQVIKPYLNSPSHYHLQKHQVPKICFSICLSEFATSGFLHFIESHFSNQKTIYWL